MVKNLDTNLSSANIRYLLALRELDAEQPGVRCTDLADRLGVSKPSAHRMISVFSERGLVTRDDKGIIYLTKQGNELSQHYIDGSKLLVQHLLFPFELCPEDTIQAVCAIMASISQSGMCSLLSQLQNRAELQAAT